MRGILTTMGVGAGLLPSILHLASGSPADVWLVLLGNLALVSLVTAGIIFSDRSTRWGVVTLAPQIACGALIGASLISPLRIAPYVLVAASAFGVVGLRRGVGGVRGVMGRTCLVTAAALINFAFLWPFTLGRYSPISHEPYLSMDLRAHTLLADVPIHDLWAASLSGGGQGRSLLDVNESMTEGGIGDVTVALAATIATYSLAARVLGLAGEECSDTLSSVVQRLTEADRERSVQGPRESGFIYHFEREALLEIQTCAVHAFYSLALEPAEGGYKLYWGAYAKRVSWVTPLYMRLIDPVRRLVVFPSILRRIEHRWRAKWGDTQRTSDAT